MKLNLKDLNPGTWFKFDENDPESGSICLRVLNMEKLAEVRDRTVTTKVDYRGANRYESQKHNTGLRDSIIWDYCIVGWEGLVDDDENETPIPCNTEMKFKLMNGHVGFAAFVESCMEKLNKLNEIHAEYLEKNLSSTPEQD